MKNAAPAAGSEAGSPSRPAVGSRGPSGPRRALPRRPGSTSGRRPRRFLAPSAPTAPPGSAALPRVPCASPRSGDPSRGSWARSSAAGQRPRGRPSLATGARRGGLPGCLLGLGSGTACGGEGEPELGQGPTRGQRASRQAALTHSGATRVSAGSGQSGTPSARPGGPAPAGASPRGGAGCGLALRGSWLGAGSRGGGARPNHSRLVQLVCLVKPAHPGVQANGSWWEIL